MTERTTAAELLATAVQQAADVACSRLERAVAVVDAPGGAPAATLLRFDLSFGSTGRLVWLVTNEDATGFADMLIGGPGDRAAALTEMHLDALTAAMSEMLERFVDGINAQLDAPIEGGDLDLGMEPELPELEPGGARAVRALDVEGFGHFVVIQQADAALAAHLEAHALEPLADPSHEPRAAHEAPATPAAHAAGVEDPDNVVPLASAGGATSGSSGAAAAPAAARSPADLEMLMNVPLPLTVELGQTQRTIRQLVDFTVGSIIELGKLAGDPLDIKVNDRVIARGEVVVIDEEFGIRITEIMSPEDRLRGLG